MTKELVISANRHETKVAVLEDDQLVEVYFQRPDEYSLAGSIHKGRVTRVLPGMQSAFVDLGLERDTFLYVSDFFEENEEYDISVAPEESRSDRPRERPRGDGQSRGEARNDRAAEPPRPVEAPQAAEPAPSLAAEPANPVAPVIASSPAPRSEERPSAERDGGQRGGEFGGDRDQRGGRRSRRRRNRGRGFPDSKYASEVGETSPSQATESVESEPTPASATGYDFAVLPGESLAKYSRSSVTPLDEGEQEELDAAENRNQPAAEVRRTESVNGAAPALEFTTSESETAQFESSEDATEVSDLPSDAAEPEPITDAPDVAPLTDQAESVEFDERLIDEGIDEAEESIQNDPEGTSIETDLDAGVPVEEAAAVAEEILGGSEEPSEGNNADAATEGDSQTQRPLNAQHREQGGRYPHRGSRRMRRKPRGGDRGDNRGENRTAENRGERSEAPRAEDSVTAAPEAAPLVRPEPQRAPRTEKPVTPSITELLKEGQEILVQIAKEPLGQKGARITSHIALPGRYVVYMPTLEHMGVSRKIASDEERHRLKRILTAHKSGLTGGYIVRTAGEGKTEDEIAADMKFLYNLWLDIRQKAEKKPAPLLLHHDLDIVQRTLRDQLTESFKAIWVDNEEVYESVLRFVQRFQPALVGRVKLYTRDTPIFDAFSITAEIEKALRSKVWLKSGGYIVVNQTEALVAIDINTGKYVGKSNRLEDTIVKTNTEAVKEIVRQVRLRDLGGIIVIDFIDMDERKNRQKVMQALEEAMRADRAPYKILQFNDFGLVAVTRKRVKQSLERALCSLCPYCEGAGYVKSVQTTIGEILQEAHKISKAVERSENIILRVHPDVGKVIKSHENTYLEEIEEILHGPVLVKSDPSMHHEKFDLA